MTLRISIIAGAVILVASLGVFLVGPQRAQDKPSVGTDEPTKIQKGVMTERERKHSKLYGEGLFGDDFPQTGDVNITITPEPGPLHYKPLSDAPQDYLQALTCSSDAVVTARISAKASQLTDDGHMVFTDYDLVIDDVLRNTSDFDLTQRTDVVLTAQGGAVSFDGRVIRVVFERDVPLRIGDTYIFFLKYLQDSQSFQLFSERGVLGITGHTVRAAEHRFTPELGVPEILTSIRTVAPRCVAK